MGNEEEKSASPGVWSALAAGFDLTAKHPWLLLLPILVDVFIWLGPRLRFQEIIEGIVANLPAEVETMDIAAQLLEIGPLTNLFTILSVPIVGVPALLSGLTPEKTPVAAQIVEIGSGIEMLGLIFLLSVLGLFLTSLYYVMVSAVVSSEAGGTENHSAGSWLLYSGKSWLRLLGLALLFFVIALAIYIPISLIGALFFLLNAALGSMVLVLAPFILVWFVVYLSFAPPGITLNGRSTLQAVKESVQLVQANLAVVLTLLLIMLILGAVVDWLLILAENGTWFTLFNILIHAFVNTGLVTAFFVLYQDRATVLLNSGLALSSEGAS